MVNERMKALGQSRSIIRELFEYGKKLAAEKGKDSVFDFSLGNPNVPAPECVTEALIRLSKRSDIHDYSSSQGHLEVRQKIADYNNQNWNVGLTADDIYMTTGAAAGLTIILNALTEEGDETVAIAPFFPEYRVFTESAGSKFVICPSKEDFTLDIDALDKAITKHTKCIIVNSPNNPAGVVYSRQEIEALSALLSKKQSEYGRPIYLISDEPYREITYGKEVVNPMNFYDNTVICYSYSKTLSLAGARIGYLAVSPRADGRRDVYAAICGAGRALGYVCAPSIFQYVIAECLGKTSDLSIYKTNRDLLYDILTDLGFDCIKPEGAFYLFVKSPCDPQKFFETCKEEGILLVPSDSLGVKGYVRIAYCVATDTIVRSAPHFKAVAEKCGL